MTRRLGRWHMLLSHTRCGGTPPLAFTALTTLALASFPACGTDELDGPDEPLGLSIIYGNNQIRWPGAELLNAISVQAVDDAGNDIRRAGVAVTWSVLSGGGSVAATSPTTDAQGRATAVWTLGTTVDDQTVEARAESQRTAVFTARAAEAGPLLFVSDREQPVPDEGGWQRRYATGEFGCRALSRLVS